MFTIDQVFEYTKAYKRFSPVRTFSGFDNLKVYKKIQHNRMKISEFQWSQKAVTTNKLKGGSEIYIIHFNNGRNFKVILKKINEKYMNKS
jgi:hypothetical protein